MKRKVPARRKAEKSRLKPFAAKPKASKVSKSPLKKGGKKSLAAKISKVIPAKNSRPPVKNKQVKKKVIPKSTGGKSGTSILKAPKISIALVESRGSVRVLRPKSFALLPAEREYGFPAETPDLPVNFGQDKLVLMTQDPERLFCYWEITPDTLAARELDRRPGEEYGEALRLNWPARSLFDSNFEIRPIDFSARHWYVSVPHPGLNYSVELGLLGNHGHFISILGSNESLTPELWNSTLARLRDVSGPLAYALRSAEPAGSSGHLQVEETRFAITDWNFSSSSGFSPAGARSPKPSSIPGKSVKVKALRIEARLEPGSRLRVGGRELTANASGKILTTVEAPEGLLSVELRLPGGERHAYTYEVTPGSS